MRCAVLKLNLANCIWAELNMKTRTGKGGGKHVRKWDRVALGSYCGYGCDLHVWIFSYASDRIEGRGGVVWARVIQVVDVLRRKRGRRVYRDVNSWEILFLEKQDEDLRLHRENKHFGWFSFTLPSRIFRPTKWFVFTHDAWLAGCLGFEKCICFCGSGEFGI